MTESTRKTYHLSIPPFLTLSTYQMDIEGVWGRPPLVVKNTANEKLALFKRSQSGHREWPTHLEDTEGRRLGVVQVRSFLPPTLEIFWGANELRGLAVRKQLVTSIGKQWSLEAPPGREIASVAGNFMSPDYDIQDPAGKSLAQVKHQRSDHHTTYVMSVLDPRIDRFLFLSFFAGILFGR